MTLSHLDEQGRSHMVDVGNKDSTRRVAVATASVCFPADVYAQIQASHGHTDAIVGAIDRAARFGARDQ